MSVGRVSDYYAERWFDQLAALTWYAALFYTSPFSTTPLTAEVTAPSYVRPRVTLERTGFNLIRNANDLTWYNLPAGTQIYYVGAFDALTGGNLIAAGELVDPSTNASAPVTLQNGGTWNLSSAEFAVGMDIVTGP